MEDRVTFSAGALGAMPSPSPALFSVLSSVELDVFLQQELEASPCIPFCFPEHGRK